MSRRTRDGTAETVSRDQILRQERGQGSIHFPCSADHKQDWQPYSVDPYSCYMCDHAYIHAGYFLLLELWECRRRVVKGLSTVLEDGEPMGTSHEPNSINNGFTGYVRKRKRKDVQEYVTI